MDASKAETPEKGGSVHNTLAVNDNVRDFVTFSETGDTSVLDSFCKRFRNQTM
jgi:hypothetical protein